MMCEEMSDMAEWRPIPVKKVVCSLFEGYPEPKSRTNCEIRRIEGVNLAKKAVCSLFEGYQGPKSRTNCEIRRVLA
jgi:hypothetical protein